MKNYLSAALVVTTALSASMAQAGGPVIIEEGNDELIVDQPSSKVGILPIIGVLVLACLVACGGGDDDDDPTSPTTPTSPTSPTSPTTPPKEL